MIDKKCMIFLDKRRQRCLELWHNHLKKLNEKYPDKRTAEFKINQENEEKNKLGKNQEIHIVLFANGKPYTIVQKNIIDSIYKMKNKRIGIHEFDLEKIKKYSWFKYLEDFPKVKKENGKRDGYFNCYFPFIIQEVYNNVAKDSLIYLVASSRHYHEGFTEHIYKLCNLANKYNFIAGHIDNQLYNDDKNLQLLNNLKLWKIIINNETEDNLNKYIKGPMVCNSFYILKKTECNDNFIKEWPYYTAIFRNDYFTDPIGSYHHCAEQNIFGILAYKYNKSVFYDERKLEYICKSKNEPLKSINQIDGNADKFIIKVRDFKK